jgi:hypothetical protein
MSGSYPRNSPEAIGRGGYFGAKDATNAEVAEGYTAESSLLLAAGSDGAMRACRTSVQPFATFYHTFQKLQQIFDKNGEGRTC